MTQDLRERISREGWQTQERAGLVMFLTHSRTGHPMAFQVPEADDVPTIANLVKETGDVIALSNKARSLVPHLGRYMYENEDAPGISDNLKAFLSENGWNVGENPHRRGLREEVFISLKDNPEAGFAIPSGVSDHRSIAMVNAQADLCMGIAQKVRALTRSLLAWADERGLDVSSVRDLPGWKEIAREAENEHSRQEYARRQYEMFEQGYYRALTESLPGVRKDNTPYPRDAAWRRGYDEGLGYLKGRPSLTDRSVDFYAREFHYDFVDGIGTEETKDEAVSRSRSETGPKEAVELLSGMEDQFSDPGDSYKLRYISELEKAIRRQMRPKNRETGRGR